MSPHRELRLAPPLAPAKFRLSQVPGDTIPQGWSGPAVSEVTDDPGSGRVTPPQAHLPLLSSSDNLVGGGAKVGQGIDFKHSQHSRPFF